MRFDHQLDTREAPAHKRRVHRSLVIALSLGLALAACKRDPNAAPPCGAVGTQFFQIARAQVQAVRGENAAELRRSVLDQLPAMRDALVHACTDSAWSDAVRRCMVGAADHVSFTACQAQLTEEQRRALDASSRR